MTEIFSTDNLFKYIFTLGAVLLLLSLYYFNTSVDNKNIERLKKYQEHELLMDEIKEGQKKDSEALEIQRLAFSHDSLKLSITKLEFPDSNLVEAYLSLLHKYSVFSDSMVKRHESRRLNLAKSIHASELNAFTDVQMKRISRLTDIGVIIGLIFLIGGGYFWWSSTYIDEIEKSKLISPQHRSVFVRCTDWLRRRKIWVHIFILCLIIWLQSIQLRYLEGVNKYWEQYNKEHFENKPQ